MQQFRNILLLAGPGVVSGTAIRRAGALAIANSARVTIAAVVEDGGPRLAKPFSSAELQRLSIKDARERLARAAAAFRDRGVRVSVEVLKGTPFAEVIRKVIRDKHDLVMLSNENGRGIKSRFLGSTALHLMRKCPCPVWVLKSSDSTPYSRVLAAVDPFAEGEEKTALNRNILDLAVSLTEAERGQLHVVHAWNLYGERILRGSARIPKQDVDKLLRDTREAHKTELSKLLEPFGLPVHVEPHPRTQPRAAERKNEPRGLDKTRIHLLKGQPADVVTNLVRKERIEVIVMGTTCRTGVGGFLIGSTAEAVLSQVNCSVLTVKPSGFVTPVALD